jgi:hypothetical protein
VGVFVRFSCAASLDIGGKLCNSANNSGSAQLVSAQAGIELLKGQLHISEPARGSHSHTPVPCTSGVASGLSCLTGATVPSLTIPNNEFPTDALLNLVHKNNRSCGPELMELVPSEAPSKFLVLWHSQHSLCYMFSNTVTNTVCTSAGPSWAQRSLTSWTAKEKNWGNLVVAVDQLLCPRVTAFKQRDPGGPRPCESRGNAAGRPNLPGERSAAGPANRAWRDCCEQPARQPAVADSWNDGKAVSSGEQWELMEPKTRNPA